MPDIYTHPNGHTVQRNSMGASIVNRGEDYKTPLNADQVAALLNKLGLWCDPETGALIMTGSWNGAVHCARVFFPDGNADGYADAKHPDRYDQVVARWRASLVPPPREPKLGEVWRITLDDGTSRNVLVREYATGAVCFEDGSGGGWYVSGFPADRRRLLVEADGTVVSDE